MAEQDYFGVISIPDDETEQRQDAVNDVTFGDIGDIKAGDDTSETFWKPNHNTFSSAIQQEKEKFRRDFDTQNIPPSPTNLLPNHDDDKIPNPHLQPPHHLLLNLPQPQQQQPLQDYSQQNPSPSPSTPQPLPLPQQPQQQQQPSLQPFPIPHVLNASPISTSQQQKPQEPQHPPLPPPHVMAQPQPQVISSQLAQPQPQPHPQQSPPRPHPLMHPFAPAPTQPPQPQPQPPFPTPPFPVNNSMSLNEYERSMVAFYDTKVRDALSRHEEHVAEQLQEALIAQRAGVSFDRSQFDRHQERTRQLILSNFYMSVQRMRIMVWQRRQQVLRQQQQQPNMSHTPTHAQPIPDMQSQTNPQIQVLEQQQQEKKYDLSQSISQHDQEQMNKQRHQQQEEMQKVLLQQQEHQHQLMQQLHRKLAHSDKIPQAQIRTQGNSIVSPTNQFNGNPMISDPDDQNFNSQSFDLAVSILAPLQDELDTDLPPVENGFQTPPNDQNQGHQSEGNKKLKSAPGLYSKNQLFSNGIFESDPRMQEIERQMAKAGLGPTNNENGSNKNNGKRNGGGGHRGKKRGIGPLFRSGDQKVAVKKTDRRLESMTDRDQELVFRVHLRQIESSAVYKDDYYSTVISKKKQGHSDKSTIVEDGIMESESDNKSTSNEVFPELAEIVQSIRLNTKERGRESGQGLKKSKRSNNQNQTDANLAKSPSANSDNNINSRPFATSLGTVQSWNPRAPRRVMGSNGTELLSPESMGDEKTSILNDVRVRVKRSIEDGYDIIAIIHDICRGESTESVEKQISLLLSNLHVREEHGLISNQERESWHSTRFFEFTCAAEKGRKYLEHVIELLDLSEMVRLMPALFANLGPMILSVRLLQESRGGSNGKSTTGEENGTVTGSDKGQLRLCRRMMRVLRDAEVEPGDCLAMLQGFIVNHALEVRTLTCALRSVVGCRLIFTCVQRILKGLVDGEVAMEEVERCHVAQFADVLPPLLPVVFKRAASGESVWDLIAGIDGLLPKGLRARYRADLTELVTKGSIPHPPQV